MEEPTLRNRKKKEDATKNQSGVQETTQDLLASVREKVHATYTEKVAPVATGFRSRSTPSKGEIMSTPIVFFLGNHSSGKSSFVNYLLGSEQIQRTGTAPLDDKFTILSHGSVPSAQDGPAVVANKNLPFATLANLEGNFQQHLQMKMVPHPLLKSVTIVDSPGMIDSIGDGRGYDFCDAVKWWAERADVVVFFFDPEKPGSTGESLQVFQEAFSGVDHKLILVMNKMDTMGSLVDVIRTSSTLSWNLAKIISTKDMPMIYLSYLPHHDQADKRSFPLAEFDEMREEIVQRIRDAPKRHADNIVTDLKRSADQLTVHARLISSVRNELWWWRFSTLFSLLLVLALAVGFVFALSESPAVRLKFGLVPLVMLVVFFFLYPRWRRDKESALVQPSYIRSTFERLYATELLSDECDVYERIYGTSVTATMNVLTKFPLLSFPSLSSGNLKKLNSVGDDVQELLEQVHESVSGKTSQTKKK